MLTFKNTNLFFGLLLVALIAVDINNPIPWYVYAGLVFIYSLFLFYGSAFVDSGFYMKVTSHGDRSSDNISITFDDGPAEQFTRGILDILNEQQVPAAFFCIGKNIPGREDLLKRMVETGHVIGNHSYSHHFWFDMYDSSKMSSDLQQMTTATEQAIGLRPRLFRPPYGVTNPNLAKA